MNRLAVLAAITATLFSTACSRQETSDAAMEASSQADVELTASRF